MITLYGFGRIFPEGVGETKDLRAQWALEETGLPYRVHALDHTGGELDSEAYTRINPFRQAPAIDDDGFLRADIKGALTYFGEIAFAAKVNGQGDNIHVAVLFRNPFDGN